MYISDVCYKHIIILCKHNYAILVLKTTRWTDLIVCGLDPLKFPDLDIWDNRHKKYQTNKKNDHTYYIHFIYAYVYHLSCGGMFLWFLVSFVLRFSTQK